MSFRRRKRDLLLSTLPAWVTGFAFLLLYLPLVALVVYSFLKFEPGATGAFSVTMEWYRKALLDGEILKALTQSLTVAGASMAVSTVVGTAGALAIERTRFPGRRFLDALTYVPLVMPEIVLGLSLLIWFVWLRLTLGTVSMILAHVTFSVSYVLLTVRARIQGFDRLLEDAARDLGADPWNTFWKVTFPLIWPGVLSGALMAFTLSFDDFLISFFTTGPGADTLPLRIYAMIKFGMSPEIHALSSLMLLATFVAVLPFVRESRRV